nr:MULTISPECIES: DeoR/GlpR transcriptional regulator [Hungatella]
MIEGTLFEDPTLDVPPATGQDGTTDYRRVVAKKAAELIEEGDIIFVNSSKTALLMLDYISGKRVSVITNNGNAITSSHDPLVSIILTGGELHGTKCSLVGDFALATIRKIRANKCFIGVSGITAEGEISTAVLQETMVNSLMIERAKDMVVILADHKRIGKLHNFIIADTHQITHIVTDELADEAVTSRLEKDNVTILKGHVTD